MDTFASNRPLFTPDIESMENEPINEGVLSTILRIAAAGMLTYGAYNMFMKSDDFSDAEKNKITVTVGEYGFADKSKQEKTAAVDHIVRNAFSKKGFNKTGEFYSINQLCEMGVDVAKKEVSCMKPYIADFEQKVETIKKEARKIIDNYHVPGTPKNTCKYKGRPLQFDPEFVVLLCAYCDYDLPLLLAQLQCESIFGVTDVASATNSLFSVGIEDSGVKAHGRYPSQDVAVMKYIKLMQNSYLVRKRGGKTVTITPTELLRSGNFVNYNGNRYASDPHYESKIKTTRNKYLSLGFGNTWEAGDPHQPLSNSRELSMNESAFDNVQEITYMPIKDDDENIADILRISDEKKGKANLFKSMSYNEICESFGKNYADAILNREGRPCSNGILKITESLVSPINEYLTTKKYFDNQKAMLAKKAAIQDINNDTWEQIRNGKIDYWDAFGNFAKDEILDVHSEDTDLFDGKFIEDPDYDEDASDDLIKLPRKKKMNRRPYPETIKDINDLNKKLVYIFGETDEFDDSRWITTNGKILNFTRPVYGEMKVMDADYIKQAGITSKEYMLMGGIKIEPVKKDYTWHTYIMATIIKRPTAMQYKALSLIRVHDYSIIIRCINDDMHTIWENEYGRARRYGKPGLPGDVKRDLERWFNEGIKPT